MPAACEAGEEDMHLVGVQLWALRRFVGTGVRPPIQFLRLLTCRG